MGAEHSKAIDALSQVDGQVDELSNELQSLLHAHKRHNKNVLLRKCPACADSLAAFSMRGQDLLEQIEKLAAGDPTSRYHRAHAHRSQHERQQLSAHAKAVIAHIEHVLDHDIYDVHKQKSAGSYSLPRPRRVHAHADPPREVLHEPTPVADATGRKEQENDEKASFDPEAYFGDNIPLSPEMQELERMARGEDLPSPAAIVRNPDGGEDEIEDDPGNDHGTLSTLPDSDEDEPDYNALPQVPHQQQPKTAAKNRPAHSERAHRAADMLLQAECDEGDTVDDRPEDLNAQIHNGEDNTLLEPSDKTYAADLSAEELQDRLSKLSTTPGAITTMRRTTDRRSSMPQRKHNVSLAIQRPSALPAVRSRTHERQPSHDDNIMTGESCSTRATFGDVDGPQDLASMGGTADVDSSYSPQRQCSTMEVPPTSQEQSARLAAIREAAHQQRPHHVHRRSRSQQQQTSGKVTDVPKTPLSASIASEDTLDQTPHFEFVFGGPQRQESDSSRFETLESTVETSRSGRL